MKSAIRKMGNSHGVIIPKPLLEEIGAKAGDAVELKIKKGKLVITPSDRSRAMDGRKPAGACGGRRGGLAWPEFDERGRHRIGRGEARRRLAGSARPDDGREVRRRVLA